MIHNRNLTRLARSVVIQALFDYAKAHKTLNRQSADEKAKAKAVATQREIEGFFAEGRENPWLELSELNLEWLTDRFQALADNPAALVRTANMRPTL